MLILYCNERESRREPKNLGRHIVQVTHLDQTIVKQSIDNVKDIVRMVYGLIKMGSRYRPDCDNNRERKKILWAYTLSSSSCFRH